jgi:hypothetical protein
MEIRINFVGGLYNNERALTDVLDTFKVFFVSGHREVHAYQRTEEATEYRYSPEASLKMTNRYDETLKYFSQQPGTLRFLRDESQPAD